MIIGYDYEIWCEYHIKHPIEMKLRSHPSLLLTGSSGSGKSYALKILLKKLLTNDVSLTFCNFKQSEDFRFLKDYEKYYTYICCEDGLKGFYASFKERQSSAIEFDGRYHILVFDECPAWILATSLCDKKLAETYKQMVSELLMLGRSYGFGIWLVMQRPDSALLANGARDNFHATITLGDMKKEGKAMLYSGESLPDRVYKPGEGICWIDGIGIREIKFPMVADMAKLDEQILERLAGSDRRETDG